MPKADRDILLAWLDYTIKKYEYEKKTKPLLDSTRTIATLTIAYSDLQIIIIRLTTKHRYSY
jgi:hypothetical protein